MQLRVDPRRRETTPSTASVVRPDSASKRRTASVVSSSVESADTTISRSRLRSRTSRSAIDRMETMRTGAAGTVEAPAFAGSGSENGSGMSMRLSDTSTSAFSMRPPNNGRRSAASSTVARMSRAGSPTRMSLSCTAMRGRNVRPGGADAYRHSNPGRRLRFECTPETVAGKQPVGGCGDDSDEYHRCRDRCEDQTSHGTAPSAPAAPRSHFAWTRSDTLFDVPPSGGRLNTVIFTVRSP